MKRALLHLSMLGLLGACGVSDIGNHLAAKSGGSLNSNERYLIFDFPDGVRGGHGRILGLGDKRDLSNFVSFLDDLKVCGATDAHIEDSWTHHTFVVAKSTPSDRMIVECFRRKTSRDFNVGVGSNDPERFHELDSSLFQDLEIVSKKAKAD